MKPSRAPDPAPPLPPAALAGAVAIGLASGALLLWQGAQPSDDAYITFRHARNLALHGWPAWNLVGAPVLGATTPLWMFVLGALGAVFGAEQLPAIALVVNALLMAASVVLIAAIVYDLLERTAPALLAAALVATNGICLYVFSLGFEAALLLALVLGCLVALRRDARRTSTLLAALAPLARPEGLLLWPIVWGVLLWRGRATRGLAAGFAVIPLLWTFGATAFYGSPVPHSIEAKRSFPKIYRPYADRPADLVARLAAAPATTGRIWQRRLEPALFQGTLLDRPWTARARAQWWLALLGAIPLLAALRRGDRYVYALYPIGFLALHGWLATLTVWYLPSFVALASALAFAGCAAGIDWGVARAKGPPWLATAGALAVFAVFASASRIEPARDPQLGPRVRDPRGVLWEQWERERFDGYRRAALALSARGDGGTALISEVGVFGYLYDGPVLDAVGICTPEAIAFYPPPRSDRFDADGQPFTTANNLVPTRMIAELAPDYVVNSLTYMEHLVRPGSAFLEAYERIGESGEAWGRPIAIYRRRTREAPLQRGDEMEKAR